MPTTSNTLGAVEPEEVPFDNADEAQALNDDCDNETTITQVADANDGDEVDVQSPSSTAKENVNPMERTNQFVKAANQTGMIRC